MEKNPASIGSVIETKYCSYNDISSYIYEIAVLQVVSTLD